MDVQWQIKQNVSEANEYLKDLNTKREQVKYLCVEAIEPEPSPSPSP